MKDCSTKGYLTGSEVTMFRHLTRKLKGVRLSLKEAEDQGVRLIQMFELYAQEAVANNNVKGG